MNNQKINFKNTKGITLIALVITIIVLLILAGVTISALSGDNGILTNASRAKYATELSQFKEELERYKGEKLLENISFEEESLMSSENSLDYNTKPEGEIGNIYNVVTNLQGSNFAGKLEIIKGELLLNSQDRTEIEVAQSVGITVNPYEILDGELISSDGNLLLMDSTGTLRLPETITSIGEGAFSDLEGLKTIIIPGTVKEIKKNAFSNNKDLETVILEEGVEVIRTGAFRDCRNLVSVSLPESLIKMESSVFMYCANLVEISLPSKIETVDSYLFYGCSNLTNIQLSKSLREIKNSSFSYCNSLTKIEIPSGVTNILAGAFDNCTNLENIILENNLNFKYENGLLMSANKDNIIFVSSKLLNNMTTFEIPEGIKNFDIDLRYSNIKKIIIPASTQNINRGMLPLGLNTIEIDSENQYMCIENNCLYTKDKKQLLVCFEQGENLQLYDNVEALCSYSFSYAPNLKQIILPESVIRIDSYVFLFSNADTIKIGKTTSSINPLFKYSNYNSKVIIDEENPYYTIENEILYNKNKTELVAVLTKINGSFIVNNSVEKISDSAFHNQINLTEIILPEGLKEIGNSFNYCSGLTEIIIPSTVEKIGSNCFNFASNLEKIKINKPKNSIDGSPWAANKGNRIVEWQD